MKYYKYILLVLVILVTSSCDQQIEKPLEYGVFYVETQGEFVVPLGADAPVVYSWSDGGQSHKGDIEFIWQHLGLGENVKKSFSSIEVSVLNHLAKHRWRLHTLEITSIPAQSGDIRTAYRYIFMRELV